MCKHKIRTMVKPLVVSTIAGWEMIFWTIMTAWIVVWYWKLDTLEMFNEHCKEIGFGTPAQKEAVHKEFALDMEDWSSAVLAHSTLAFFFVLLAVLLFAGLHCKSRLMVLLWMFLSTANGIARLVILNTYVRAYQWLYWWEFYWIFRGYFLVSTGHYCLDLWGEVAGAEHLDIPLLIQVDEGRSRRVHAGALRDDPTLLDDRPRVYGQSRQFPSHLDHRFVADVYPDWFQSTDEQGRPILVLDTPAYEVDRRVGRMRL